MTDRESAVPLDRQDAMQTATDDGNGFWLDRHPPTDWHDCPDCGTRRYEESLFQTGTDDILAVTDACLHDGCLARWVWETQTDERHYRGKAEVVDIGERETDDTPVSSCNSVRRYSDRPPSITSHIRTSNVYLQRGHQP